MGYDIETVFDIGSEEKKGLSEIRIDNEVRTYKLNTDKIKTLKDVKNILKYLNISITVQGGLVCHKGYDLNILEYMD
jgi:hypothetical protein